MKKTIDELFRLHNVEFWGVCEFEKTLPLIECRAKLRLPQNPKSVIVCLFPYYVGENKNRNVSKYAVVPDYHNVAMEILTDVAEKLTKLYPKNSFQPFVDSSPIREVAAAYNCGLGVVGKNGLLINKKYGSFVFVGEIVTNLEITPSLSISESCLNCHKCENACLGGALKNGRINKDKCLSHITQKKGELTPLETSLVKKGGLVWGCDTCSDVCPLNKNVPQTPIEQFYKNQTPVYNGVFQKTSAYAWRPKTVIERNLLIVKENKDGISN